jgi:hypothetical protein
MTEQPPSTEPPPPARRRSPAVAVIMVIVGIVLLLPGVCSLFFMGNMGRDAGALGVLWLVCFLISAGGVALIVKAFR